MSEQKDLVPVEENWRARVFLLGGAVGTALGLLSAYLYVRAAEKTYGDEAPQAPEPRDAVKLGMLLLSIVRTITEWGSRR
ncbi:MAG TPA: hypothetical protein ENI95_05545 [Chloroflexi bacterium]|nr:hypothetical protein [Chloroflexota bacterium]